jgi:hypothetical protein
MIECLRRSESLVGEIARLLKSWLRVDQIRTSPRDGEIWRLEPGATLNIEGGRARVVARTIGEDARGPFVAYLCETIDGTGELSARPTGAWSDFDRDAWRTPQLNWREEGRSNAVDPAAVEVICRCSNTARRVP